VSREINKSRENNMLIEDLTDDEKEARDIASVSKNGLLIAGIHNPSKAVQLAAIAQYANAFCYIQNPDEDVKLAAVERDGTLIHKIENPSKRILKIVINNNGLAILHIGKVPIDVIDECKRSILKAILESFKESQHNDYYTPMIMIRVLQDKYKIQWPELKIIKKSVMHEYENHCKAVKLDENIRFDRMSEEKQLAAVKQNGSSIRYIEHPSDALLNLCKNSIIKYILIEMKNGDITLNDSIFNKLNDTNWPELDIIKKSLAHDNI
jgi:hypothetical protein